MGTAETLVALAQGRFYTSAKRRLVKHSKSDNDAKFHFNKRVERDNRKMGINHLSCSLTELNTKARRCLVPPSIGLHCKPNIIRKVPSQTEMWECIRSNYTFLMKDDLVVACQKTREEMSWCDGDPSSLTILEVPKWTCTEFIHRFNELHDSLHDLQAIAFKEKDKSSFLRNTQNNLRNIWNECQVLKEQATLLEIRYPNMRDDISRRCNILNNKWEALQQAIWPKLQQKQNGLMAEMTARMKHIRRWLRDVDSKLKNLKATPHWSMTQILTVYDSQKALQLEIETRGREITSLLKRVAAPEGVSVDSCKVLHRVVQNLERYWHAVWLQSLENHYLTEQILEQKKSADSTKSKQSIEPSDTDEGPRTKHRRLTGDHIHSSVKDCNPISDMDTQSSIQAMSFQKVMTVERKQTEKSSKSTSTFASTREVGTFCSVNKELLPVNDKCIMVGSTGIAALKAKYGDDFSNFEIIQDVGYSSESSTHLSSDDVNEYIRVYSYSPPRKMGIDDRMAEAGRSMLMQDTSIPPSQRMFGHSSLGSSSSHNDSGFGPSESILCDSLGLEETADGSEIFQNREWPSTKEDLSDGGLEDVLDFHLSFPDTNDNSPVSVEFTLDGFDTDGSADDFHNRSSFTSDVQVFYKVTSIDSENGDLDTPEKETVYCVASQSPLEQEKSPEFESQTQIVCQDNSQLTIGADDNNSDIPQQHSSNSIRDNSKENHSPEVPSSLHEVNNELDSDMSDEFYLDLDPRKNMTSSPLRSFHRSDHRQLSPSCHHRQQREFPSRHHMRRKTIQVQHSSAHEKSSGVKTVRSKRVREWLSHSHGNIDTCRMHKRSEDDSPIRDCRVHYYHPMSLNARIDSSCDGSGEYTTTTESDGDGSITWSSEDCETATANYPVHNVGFASKETVIPLEHGLYDFGQTSQESLLLLPPPPPPTPPSKEIMSCGDSDQPLRHDESESDSERTEGRLLSTYRTGSNGYLNSGSFGFSAAKENSSSTTINDTSNPRLAFSLKSLRKRDGTSSESSAGESNARDQRLTRSLPSILQRDSSLLSSTSDNCHSHPSEPTRSCDNSRSWKTNYVTKSQRRRKRSSSSSRSFRNGRRRRQTVSECCSRKRHWSVVQTSLQARVAKAGAAHGNTATVDADLDIIAVASPERDLILTNVEEQSTVSDQVWDGYQEMPYLSEAYSEPNVDEDAIRKLTEFGDDYCSAIGQSLTGRGDCDANSLITKPPHNCKDNKKEPSPNLCESDEHDTDSDIEDLYDILADTYKALQFAKSTYSYKKDLCDTDFAELIATCQTHIQCLKTILQHLDTDGKANCLEQLYILIKEWKVLHEKLDMSEKFYNFEAEIVTLEKKISSFDGKDRPTVESITSYDELKEEIKSGEAALKALGTVKEEEMPHLNFRVRELTVTNKSLGSLDDKILHLYQNFGDTFNQMETRLVALYVLLERFDQYATTSDEVIRQITEREAAAQKGIFDEYKVAEDEQLATYVWYLRKNADFFAGKMKSGIPVTKDLKALEDRLLMVATSDGLRTNLFPELRLGELSSRERPCHPTFSVPAEENEDENVFTQSKLDASAGDGGNGKIHSPEAPRPPEKKKWPRSKLWRAFRASLPIQLAVMLLYCLACAFEPHCCDLLNNFNFSFSPQLRYIRGPPPV